MNSTSFYKLLFLFSFIFVELNAKIVENTRIHEHKLSDKDHYTDLDNDKKFEHNTDYDHEAFLGKEEADSFKTLTPEESKSRLGKIVDKIDANKDGYLVEDELKNWIKNITHKNIMKEVESRWSALENNNSLHGYLEYNYGSLKYFDKIDKNRDNYVNENELRNWIRLQHRLDLQKNTDKKWSKVNTNHDDYLLFDELIDNTIGQPDTWSEEEKKTKQDDYKKYLKLMERDKKRFKVADQDNDGKLSKKEFGDFLHPEESKAMRNIVIDETLEDLDKNGDGVVNIDEFINDLYPNEAKLAEPDWVKTEREQFKLHRDKNKDNVMDREELAEWILPNDFDHSLMEAKHLVHEADVNRDGKLTKEEILEKYSVFVASQATGYGHAIYERQEL